VRAAERANDAHVDSPLSEAYLELGFLALVGLSAGIGFLFRARMSPRLRRPLLITGLVPLALGLLVLGLAFAGWMPFGVWTSGLTSVLFLALAAVVLPFAITVALAGKGSPR